LKALALAKGTSRRDLGWVRKLHVAPIPEETTSEIGRIIFISRSFGLGCANSRGLLVITSSLWLGWKGCGLRRSTFITSYIIGSLVLCLRIAESLAAQFPPPLPLTTLRLLADLAGEAGTHPDSPGKESWN
jgi:hypothetical protein